MHYWLVKTEPDTFSIDDLKREGVTSWTGVRNFAARKNIRAMKKGDRVFIYHTGSNSGVVGEGRVASLPYPEKKDDWTTIDIQFVRRFPHIVPRIEILKQKVFKNSILARQGRLSVQPVTAEETLVLKKLSKEK